MAYHDSSAFGKKSISVQNISPPQSGGKPTMQVLKVTIQTVFSPTRKYPVYA